MNGYKYNHQLVKYPDYSSFERCAEAKEWCIEQFGPEYSPRWGLYLDGFNFRDEQDYVLFLLKWV